MTPEQREALVERIAKKLASIENQRQLDCGFAAEHDFPDDHLEGDWEEYVADARAALSIAEEEIERLWREKEEGRRRLVETAFDGFERFELDWRKLRAICCGLSSAPPTAEERERAAGEAKRLGLHSSRGE